MCMDVCHAVSQLCLTAAIWPGIIGVDYNLGIQTEYTLKEREERMYWYVPAGLQWLLPW